VALLTILRLLPAALVALALLAGPSSASAQDRPGLSGAAAAIVVDAREGTVLLAKNPNARRSIASTTKLMTALLTLERSRPSTVFEGTDYQAGPMESKINLARGERMRVGDLLEALLLESANDAAVALAQGVSGSREAFVRDMNTRARELGLRGTSYANPIGLDAPSNYSTATDLATLTRRLLRDRLFARIVRMPSAQLESGNRPRMVDNRNELVRDGVRPVTGVKTGHTGSAGYVLVGSARGSNGARVVSAVLGEPGEAARDAESLAALRWGVAQYRRTPVLDSDRPMARADVELRSERVALVPATDLNLTLRRGQRVGKRVDAPEELEGPLPAGRRVGTIDVLQGDRVVRRVPLVTAADVQGASVATKMLHSMGAPLTLLAALAILLGVSALVMRRVRA
jgi:serine-type D-Ala-D-Ala carboxypeptidase (penicillin-binding protein 5/6)